MAKGPSVFTASMQNEEDAGNTGASWLGPVEAESRVLAMQTKLNRWATADPGRRFDDLYNLVYDPAFLVTAWRRVRGNKGARTSSEASRWRYTPTRPGSLSLGGLLFNAVDSEGRAGRRPSTFWDSRTTA